jgi:hypothetical protein
MCRSIEALSGLTTFESFYNVLGELGANQQKSVVIVGAGVVRMVCAAASGTLHFREKN